MDGKDSRPWRGPIAVVGSGIAGLGAACLLSLRYQVDLYETADYFGGHTNTVDVEDDGAALAVDTGFIVFNRPNYPTLSALFEHLGVKTRPTDMSFAASVDGGRIEYAGDSLNALYAQRRNLISPRFQAMVWDILRFNRLGKQLLAGPGDRHLTLGEWLARERFGDAFRDYYLLPMAASIWSCPTATMTEFPALSLLRFFANHGLLDLRDRPQWHTVCGGSRRYVERMLEGISGEKRTGAGVQAVLRDEHGVRLYLEDGSLARYQQVVIATHADQALLLLDQADSLERSVLGAFRYQPNRAVLHTDPALMPRRRRVWSSWNYLAERDAWGQAVSVTYWMNRLQNLPATTPYLVSLNPLQDPAREHLLREFEYSHPVFDRRAMTAQGQLERLQGRGDIWFCGSYFGYGFHEDGLRSAVQVAEALGVVAPWAGDTAESRVDRQMSETQA